MKSRFFWGGGGFPSGKDDELITLLSRSFFDVMIMLFFLLHIYVHTVCTVLYILSADGVVPCLWSPVPVRSAQR